MSQITKRFRRTAVLGFTSLVFLIVVCVTMTLITAHAYAGTCSQLSGFPGLLQRMGFVAVGTCITKPGGTVCAGGSVCTPPGGATGSGTCTNQAALGQPPSCFCKPNSTSN